MNIIRKYFTDFRNISLRLRHLLLNFSMIPHCKLSIGFHEIFVEMCMNGLQENILTGLKILQKIIPESSRTNCLEGMWTFSGTVLDIFFPMKSKYLRKFSWIFFERFFWSVCQHFLNYISKYFTTIIRTDFGECLLKCV